MRAWSIRVAQEYVLFAESADDVLATMQELKLREHEGLSLVDSTACAAPVGQPQKDTQE